MRVRIERFPEADGQTGGPRERAAGTAARREAGPPSRPLVVEAGADDTLLTVLRRGGVSLAAPCGGRGRCGKCRVRVTAGSVRGDAPDGAGAVRACRAIPVTDVIVEPVDGDRAYDGGAYQDLPPGGAERGDGRAAGSGPAGAALDIGTTTVSARLVDLVTGTELDTYSALNAQKVYGADVMSRIGAARSGKTADLFHLINRQTAAALAYFQERRPGLVITTLAVAGNTTMLHLFANTDPSPMGEAPFNPVFLEDREIPGADLGLPVDRVILLPSISAFVGADIVAGLAAVDAVAGGGGGGADPVFFIDIGTNGEMAVVHDGVILAASTAAGPALEGAEISCGAGSVRGAINRVTWRDGAVRYGVIGGDGEAAEDGAAGGAAPVGICGCGLIDAIALMRDRGVIDETGAFVDEAGEREFGVAPGIAVTGRDVRQFQLAKSAIRSGIELLCAGAGLTPAGIARVYVAGGLGFYINQERAARAGLLPEAFLGKVVVGGNTSLKGAVRALVDPSFLGACRRVVAASRVLDLAANPAFMDAFADNMLFP